MPSTATITTFHTFVAGQKARASEVNTNFDVFRGHIVPVNTDTQTASNNTHDLGASDRQWRRVYAGDVYLNGTPLAKIHNVDVVYPPHSFVGNIIAAAQPGLVGPNILASVFYADTDTAISFFVPLSSYAGPNAVSLIISGYAETSPAAVFRAETSLYRADVTLSETLTVAERYTSTATFTFTTGGVYFKNTSVLLAPTTGVVGSLTLTGSNTDYLAVTLRRLGSSATEDTSTGRVFITDIQVNFGG